jgi:hypothetical protein
MVNFDWIKAAFRSDPVDQTAKPTEPIAISAASIIGGRLQEQKDLRAARDRYTLADNFVNSDERLFSAIELMAIMVQKAVGVITLRPEDADDRIETPAERKAIKAANDFHRKINGPRLFYRFTKDLWKYGDAVDQIKFGKGIEGLVPLPMFVITAVDKRAQVGKTGADFVISNPKYFAVDEQDGKNDIKTQIIRHDRIFHVSFDNNRSWIKDNLGRWTFNVWSTAPINSLIGILMWKQILIQNDQIWRNRALPREHHRLDLTPFDPSKYQGTHAEKIAAANAAATAAINSYAAVNAYRSADQGFVTGMNTEIGYVEPKTSNYNDPSGILDQINQLIGGPTGTPPNLMGSGESGGGFTSLNQASSFLALRAEIYLDTIKEKYETLLKRHVSMVEPGINEEIVERLELKTRLILDKDRTELAKIVATLSTTKSFTVSELREVMGKDPLTEDQEEELKKWIEDTQNPGAGEEGNSADDVAASLTDEEADSPTSDQESPGQRDRNSNTIGDGIGGR